MMRVWIVGFDVSWWRGNTHFDSYWLLGNKREGDLLFVIHWTVNIDVLGDGDWLLDNVWDSFLLNIRLWNRNFYRVRDFFLNFDRIWAIYRYVAIKKKKIYF
jgi:hypothetical protein